MKNLKVTVNGVVYDVKVEETDENVDYQGDSYDVNSRKHQDKKLDVKENISTGESLKAPISGTVVSINVSEGQNVKKGDVLLIIEAMKMENEIVSPRDAIVSKINIKKGESVDSGTPLVFLN